MFILVLQYIFLLLNINQTTSLVAIPDYLWDLKNMSVSANFIKDSSLQVYLAFDND